MTKFLEEMTNFIFLEDVPKKADVIFVPGSEEGALAKTAARLYLEGYAPLIVPSGKYAKWTGHSIVGGFETESDYFAHLMMEEGVPETAIIKEREATYTYLNAINTKKLLDISLGSAINLCNSPPIVFQSAGYTKTTHSDFPKGWFCCILRRFTASNGNSRLNEGILADSNVFGKLDAL